MTRDRLSFLFLRLPIAMSFLGHGLVRIPKLEAFSNWMAGTMEKSAIPQFLILPFGYTLPFAEALLGISLVIGFQVRYTLYAGLLLMCLLIFGSASVENWTAIEAQLIHSIYLAFLLWLYETKYGKEKL